MKQLLIILFSLFSLITSAQVKVIGKVVPNSPSDLYPTNEDIYMQGGMRVVANTTERDAISADRRKNGMLVYTRQDDIVWKLDSSKNPIWVFLWQGSVNDLIMGLLPNGERNQLMYANGNGNIYTPKDNVFYGKVVYTDAQLARAKQTFTSQAEIFNTWGRFSFGGDSASCDGALSNSNFINYNPYCANNWIYDTENDLIESTSNSSSYIGFLSDKSYSKYYTKLTLGSTDVDDDDVIYVIGSVKDFSDLTRNLAYGKNPNDFDYSVNTTDKLLPREHQLSVVFSRNNKTLNYVVYYNYRQSDQKTIFNGSNMLSYRVGSNGASPTTDSTRWNKATGGIDVAVYKNADTIKIWCSEFSDAPGGKGPLSHLITLNLNSDPDLQKFIQPTQYGYGQRSQAFSYFKDIYFSESVNTIYDLRNGDVWEASSIGNYTLNENMDAYDQIGVRRLWRNPEEKTFGWTYPNRTFDVIHDSIYSGGGSLDEYQQLSDKVTTLDSSNTHYPSTSAVKKGLYSKVNTSDIRPLDAGSHIEFVDSNDTTKVRLKDITGFISGTAVSGNGTPLSPYVINTGDVGVITLDEALDNQGATPISADYDIDFGGKRLGYNNMGGTWHWQGTNGFGLLSTLGLMYSPNEVGIWQTQGAYNQKITLQEGTARIKADAIAVENTAGDNGYTLPVEDGDSGDVLTTDGNGTATWKNQNIAGARYFPTLSSGTNVSSVNGSISSYMKVANVVHVTIDGNITPTAANTLSDITFTLPFATTLTTQGRLGIGTLGINGSLSGFNSGIITLVNSTTAKFTFFSGTPVASGDMALEFQYLLQ